MAWRDNVLFAQLTPAELDEIERRAQRRELASGVDLFREGEPASELFLLESGSLEVWKRDAATGGEARLARVSTGDVIGEVALIDRGLRSASVRALAPSVVLAIPYEACRSVPGAYVKLIQSLAERLTFRLRANGEDALKAAVERLVMAQFVISTCSLLALYILVLGLLPRVRDRLGDTAFVSIPLLVVFGLTTVHFVRKSGLPLQTFGLGTLNLSRSIVEGLLFTLPPIALLIAMRWSYLKLSGATEPLFEWRLLLAHYGRYHELGYAGVYALFTFVQEFVARSGLQTPLEQFLPGKHRRAQALVGSNLLFATTHMHVSVAFSFAVFFAGLFWGWLYRRHGNLAGCFVNHLVVGTFLFFVMGIGQ